MDNKKLDMKDVKPGDVVLTNLGHYVVGFDYDGGYDKPLIPYMIDFMEASDIEKLEAHLTDDSRVIGNIFDYIATLIKK